MGVHVTGASQTSDIMTAGRTSGGQAAANQTIAEALHTEETEEGSMMPPQPEELERQADGINKMLEATFTNLKFNVHDKLNRVYVQVLNRDTDEVIREIPPEKFLDMKAAILEQVGLLVDEKV
ncbi:flagellar protein FlaG [Salibacterium aidingense]|uniref:flagellar protein FlaG n=1 Tax=Salibacterium aidingense TaxID=384933 RepID=UPI00041FCEC9|nr:flagellar protein FlaG [Salibacterium aidingense]